MATLLDDLTADQAELVRAVCTGHNRLNGEWPPFSYVEQSLDRLGLDAGKILITFPVVGGPYPHQRSYRAVWWEGGTAVVGPQSTVRLTVLGVHHAQRLGQPVMDLLPSFFSVLQFLIVRKLGFEPDPAVGSGTPTVGGQEIRDELSGWVARAGNLRHLRTLLEFEPPTWGCVDPATWGRIELPTEDIDWCIHPDRQLLSFKGIRDIAGYAECLERTLQPVAPSALTIPIGTSLSPWESPATRPAQPLRMDAELWAVVGEHLDQGRWETATREACVFFEDWIRRRGGLPPEKVGLDLMRAAFHPQDGVLRLGGSIAGEADGWFALARGAMGAVRNAVGHRVDDRPDAEEFATGAIGLLSLIVTQVRFEHGDSG